MKVFITCPTISYTERYEQLKKNEWQQMELK